MVDKVCSNIFHVTLALVDVSKRDTQAGAESAVEGDKDDSSQKLGEHT